MVASGSAPPEPADLELSLTGFGDGQYEAAPRYTLPGGGAEAHLVEPPLPRVRVDAEALQALRAQNLDPAAYGALLEQLHFADPQLQAGVARGRAAADEAGASCLARLDVRGRAC
jgi:hypothetical protein